MKEETPIRSVVKEEIKEDRERSVLPDYLRDFFAEDNQPSRPATESVQENSHNDPTTTFKRVDSEVVDDDEDDAIVVERKY